MSGSGSDPLVDFMQGMSSHVTAYADAVDAMLAPLNALGAAFEEQTSLMRSIGRDRALTNITQSINAYVDRIPADRDRYSIARARCAAYFSTFATAVLDFGLLHDDRVQELRAALGSAAETSTRNVGAMTRYQAAVQELPDSPPQLQAACSRFVAELERSIADERAGAQTFHAITSILDVD